MTHADSDVQLQRLRELRSRHAEAGEVEEARAAHQRLAALMEERARAEPEVPDHLRQLALDSIDMANWFWDSVGRLDEVEPLLLAALAAWKQLARAFPAAQNECEVVKTYFDLGILYGSLGRVDAAEEAYRRALGLVQRPARCHPETPEYAARRASCANQLGTLYLETGRLDRAEAAFRKALDLRTERARSQPDDADNAVGLGGTQGKLGHVAAGRGRFAEAVEWYEQAIQTLDRVVRQDGHNARAQSFLADAREGRDSAAKAPPFPDLGITGSSMAGWRPAGPPPRLLSPEAQAAHAAGGLEAALAAVDVVLRQHEDHVGALFDRGDLLRALSRAGEALAAANRLLELWPQDAAGWYLQGLILGDFLSEEDGRLAEFHPDRQDRAIDAFDRALLLRLNDADAWLYKARALVRAAHAAQAHFRGLVADAARTMDEARVRAFVDPQRRRFLCYCTRARESFDAAARLRPDDHQAPYEKGRLLVDLLDGEEADALAEEAFALAVARRPDLADAWYERARIADRRGDRRQARDHLGRALAADPALGEPARHDFDWFLGRMKDEG
jgi:tetratricopeptide (TPR) repeat protein